MGWDFIETDLHNKNFKISLILSCGEILNFLIKSDGDNSTANFFRCPWNDKYIVEAQRY